VSSSVNQFVRSLVYPGLDLHTRNRASLCRYWKTGPRDVLDAGSGNGYFSWLAYKSGARVLAVNMERAQVEKSEAFLIGYLKADPARLTFEQRNLYDLNKVTQTFDEIICYETLEHIRDDAFVVSQFYRVLRPGGLLHVCCPYRLHPRHLAEKLDMHETGGHVRAGYTEEDYRQLLEPAGFRIERTVGIGSKSVYVVDKVLRAIRNRAGDAVALPLLPLGLLAVSVARMNPPVPFSIYVQAVKAVPAA
jgi:SAM-dependent methyltransferase